MECRKFEITLVSAQNLPNIRFLKFNMRVYAEVSLNGEPKTLKKITVDSIGMTNPRWNFPVAYTINQLSIRKPGLEVVVKLYCEKSFKDDECIGEVKIPVKNLLDSGLKAENEQSYDVAGTRDGKLNILYDFSDIFLVPKPFAMWGKVLEFGIAVIIRGTWCYFTGDDGEWIPTTIVSDAAGDWIFSKFETNNILVC